MRIVVDTNVIVSALVFGGLPRQVLNLADVGLCLWYFSAAIKGEVERVLKEKFGWSTEEISARGRILWSWGTLVKPKVWLSVVKEDADDNRILECAMAAEADAIISGDRHLLRLGSFQSIPIQSPRQFLELEAWETTP